MIDIVKTYLKLTFIISAALYAGIFMFFIIPTIKTSRKVYWSDWIGKNYNHFSYLEEYKAVCKKNDYSLLWYKLCWSIFFFLIASVTACFIIFII